MAKRKQEVEDIEIEEVEKTPEVTEEIAPNELETLKAQMVEKDKLIADERAKAEEVVREREVLRREKEELSQKYTRESTQKVKFQTDSIESRIAATKTESESLEKQMEDAIEKGDFKAYAKINTQFTRNQLAIDRLNDEKTQIETIKATPVETPTQIWIRNHPEFNTDSIYKNIAIGADGLAQRKGIRVESPEYFQFVEKILDRDYYNKEEEVEEVEEVQEVAKPRLRESAPPSRGNTSTSNPKRISLTPGEVEVALSTYGTRMTAAEAKLAYWQAKQEAIRNGDITGE